MLLGKRPRQLMKRTTSMTEMTFDLNASVGGSASAPQSDPQNPSNQAGQGLDHQRFLAMASPRNHRRTTAEIFETKTASFLRSCSLCKRRLVPGRDIYMYRGDSAFCSLECRQQQMNQDERMEKCSLASKKGAAASSSTKGTQVSTKGETVAAL
ncbi:hypothetical protein CJ030_MR7G012510 [Morella rubra]|uniref:FLZ-type domain-containing protein n=1 Tax=Morella rubra TaxID=262757 RepID=A0A6A1V5E6_9ROSI|nr:hypothetical protein CJ030_MR0G012575 [Morella rubra]KAB1205462.1 hypothetical protein CJ030_MR7G010597 [Morella rubra]KAB1207446.1 hypothetical protein CJ030_MR7G012510 [Morella rubra]